MNVGKLSFRLPRILQYQVTGKKTPDWPHVLRICLISAGVLYAAGSITTASAAEQHFDTVKPAKKQPQSVAKKKPRKLEGVGDALANAGIHPHLLFWSLVLNNVSTGPRHGEYGVSNDLFAGADFNLQKLASIPDATFHFEYIFFPGDKNTSFPTGPSYLGAAGSYFAGAPLHNDISTGYLSEFSYEQKFFNGRLDTVIGRTNAARYFYRNNCASVITCNDPIWENSTGILPPPYGSWSGYARLSFPHHSYFKLGAFESDPQQYLDKGNGWDWNTNDSAGVSILTAVGHKTTFEQARYAGHYELMGFINTDNQTDPETGETDNSSVAGVMFKFRQAIWRPRDSLGETSNPQALSVFGSLDAAPEPDQPFQSFAEAGLVYGRPFSRPADTVSIKASYAHIGSRQLFAQRNLRMLNGGSDDVGRDETYRIAFSYHLGLPHRTFLEPAVEYVINPSNFYNGSATSTPDDGFIVGLQFGTDIGNLIGLTR